VMAENGFGFWSSSYALVEIGALGQILAYPDNTHVTAWGVVSAVFDGFSYIESEKRERGIRVIADDEEWQQGDHVSVEGKLTTIDGERAIIADRH